MMEQHAREIEQDQLRQMLSQRFFEMIGNWRQSGKANEQSGLLTERGQGVYTFSHLTFQGHLAARAISDKADYIQYTLQRLSDSWWREVVQLEAGYLSMQGKQRATILIRAIMECVDEPEPYHNLVFAAKCLRDVGQARVTGDLSVEVQHRPLKEFETLLRRPALDKKDNEQLAQVNLLTLIRRRAAAALGRVESGGGVHSTFWRTPFGEPVWLSVAAGEFWMGGDGELDRKPVHRVFLPAFQISKAPITNAHYSLFVGAVRYPPP
jgi:hypothetical protein